MIMRKVEFEAAEHMLQGWIALFGRARHQQRHVLQIRAAALSCCVYGIWDAGNSIIFKHEVVSLDVCCFRISQMLACKWVNSGIGRSRSTEKIELNFRLV